MQSTKQKKWPTRKRQWGAERRTEPLPMMHEKPSTLKIAYSRLAIVLTIVLWILYLISTIIRQFFQGPKTFSFTMQAIGYLIIVTLLTFSALMYLVARQGALQRFSKHVRVPRAELDRHFSVQQPSITVLVPSYSEEPEVVRKTLMSAALQEYPGMHVVLLVDDNPHPSNSAVAARLNATREIGTAIMRLLAEPRTRFSMTLSQFEYQYAGNMPVTQATIIELANHYAWAATWLNALADKEEIDDHVDIFFVEQVLRGLANELSLVGQALMTSCQEGVRLPIERVRQLYRRLAWIFDAEVTIFERKKYASLSHEANKAMNLNSYIGLMGGTYLQRETPDGLILIPVAKGQKGDVTFPDSEFLLTLDADSILLREYCLRLVYFLQQPDNARVAVTQTPYSSFRGAGTRIERLAAATTDIQHILHQGMSYYGATFWVGANAVIRKRALDDIAETEWVGGFEVRRFIQDRTVIEDTESSIDLTLHGWSLVNYPERLSYSATPPDFGSLIVQRRRWANGGLLILPKLWAQTRERRHRGELVSRTEILLRLNYMASITWSSFSLIFMLAYPFDGRLLSPFVVLAALPYFISMASDLKYCGYKRTDILRIYGFNLILLPVNLAGVLKSLQQALTSKKIPFARTPKVKDRTISPLLYIIVPLLIVAFSAFTFWRDMQAHNWVNAAFECFNALTASWALVSYIGIGNALADIWHGLTGWLYVEKLPKRSAAATDPQLALDWRAVLYHGNAKERVPLSALHAAAGSYQSVNNEQRLPDADVSLFSTMKMRAGVGLRDVSLFSTMKMRAGVGLRDVETVRQEAVSIKSKSSATNEQYSSEPRRRLSLWRVLLAILILASLPPGIVFALQQWHASQPTVSNKPWFASYVDVTATPIFTFEQLGTTSNRDAVLSFIVSSPMDACTPSWGGAYTLSQATGSLDLERRIAHLQQQGGSVAISFGGQKNQELAGNCTDPGKLFNAYQSVVNRYNINTIDLDLEGAGLTDAAAASRRGTAIARLQSQRRAAGKQFAVWVTLPVTPQGLDENGTNAVSQLLMRHVDLAGINVMTMDYGSSLVKGATMVSASESALIQAERQLGVLYQRAGVHLNDATLWTKIGATPMIGQNDTSEEVFTLADATELNHFVLSHKLGRMSMWSANRDTACGTNYVFTHVVSDACSGVQQDAYGFANRLGAGFDGSIFLSAGLVTTADTNSKLAQQPDNPATSPYQIWSPTGAYLKGTKVVWHHNVYQAKWWTQGDVPDNPVLQQWQTPWTLIGPVLPGEKPIPQPTLPAGTYPNWSGTITYNTGDRVLFNGVPYQAKWWNTGQSPAAATSNPDSSPWIPLTQEQINAIVAPTK